MKVGRKPQTRNLWEWLWIGVENEKALSALALKKANARDGAETRKRAAQTEAGRDAINLGSDALAKFRDAQRELQEIDPQARGGPTRKHYIKEAHADMRDWREAIRQPGRRFKDFRSVPITRPWGERPRLLKLIANKASRHFGRRISPRTVAECVAWYRRDLLTH